MYLEMVLDYLGTEVYSGFTMIRSLLILLLLTSLSGSIRAGEDKKDKVKHKDRVVSMPEPSALPELLICISGLGFIAYRQRGNGRVQAPGKLS
jgi:hypothetical protein